jgi:tetratricopeptide (TPR) repeat protein
MRHSITRLTSLALVSLAAPVPAAAAAEHGSHGEELGAVEVHASCEAAAMPHLQEGLALLHHMTYERADQAFAGAADADPACALAYWGRAMTSIHPLWTDPPTAGTFRRGEQFVQKAKSLQPSTPEERAYIAAVEGYYRAGRSATEAANLAAFADGWAQAHEQHPDDLEAASFHALGLLATADPQDKTFARQTRAAEIAADIRARVPQHPGAHHYIIHALDYPPLADQALEVARRYGDIAPEVPHALHMPTHIFTRLGLWRDSIAWNERSAAAALKQPVDGAISLHYLHALDYLAYAHLQLRQDEKATEVLRALEALDQPMQVELAVPYTLAAVPARLALERKEWARAAALAPRVPESYPWDRFPAMEAITWFARALGAARTGDVAAAEAAIGKLASLREAAAESSTYWGTQVDIRRTAASAWLAYAKDADAQALELMRKAAELEASTEKHPVTPGEVLPATELLGDMLMELGRHADARAAYEASLARSPNRYNSLSGAARAAEREGNAVAAERYARELVALVGEAG